MTVKAEFLNPFITSAAEVLRAEAGIEVKRGSVSLECSSSTTQDVTTLISLVGDVEGMVLFSASQEMSLGLVSAMMGEALTELDTLAQSGIAELGNVIAGRAAMKLSQVGYSANISVPTLIIGRGATISTLDFQRLVVNLDTELGTMQVHLGLREKVNGHGQ
ncbi:MAG: chemotaxis protein CheX [Anaerolineae bacterium]